MRDAKSEVKIEFVEWDGSEVCAQVSPEMFYDIELTRSASNRLDREYLRSICKECPRLNECRTYAIKHEAYGFWGGMTEQERTEYRKKHKMSVIRPELYSDYLPRLQNGEMK
jgi:WhiB family redox-sensing transcriptional regulator